MAKSLSRMESMAADKKKGAKKRAMTERSKAYAKADPARARSGSSKKPKFVPLKSK